MHQTVMYDCKHGFNAKLHFQLIKMSSESLCFLACGMKIKHRRTNNTTSLKTKLHCGFIIQPTHVGTLSYRSTKSNMLLNQQGGV